MNRCEAAAKRGLPVPVDHRGPMTDDEARAFLDGRDYVVPSDLQELAMPVLGVRLAVEHDRPDPVLREILDTVPLPEYR